MQQQQERSNNSNTIHPSPQTRPRAHKVLLAVANWPHKFPRQPPSPLSGAPPNTEKKLGCHEIIQHATQKQIKTFLKTPSLEFGVKFSLHLINISSLQDYAYAMDFFFSADERKVIRRGNSGLHIPGAFSALTLAVFWPGR